MSLASRPAPRTVLIACAALAAGVMLFAATEPAHGFKLGPVMRPMIAKPHGPVARSYGAMSDVGYTVTVTDTQTGMRRRHLTGVRNAHAGDPGNVELTVKVLNATSTPSMRPGKFRVVEREQLQ